MSWQIVPTADDVNTQAGPPVAKISEADGALQTEAAHTGDCDISVVALPAGQGAGDRNCPVRCNVTNAAPRPLPFVLSLP
jgi:hypothetical protein